MELKIEELKVGDELLCIDREGFLSASLSEEDTKDILDILNSEIIVDIVDSNKNWVFLKGDIYSLNGNELKYFKKKEQSQYTFDDLIDVAVQAYKDRVVNGFTVVGEKLNCQTLNGEDYNLGIGKNVLHGIEYLQSLYKETFVIESEEDLKRIKDDAQITMTNGEILDYKDALSLESYINSFILKLLKGAAVTQSK